MGGVGGEGEGEEEGGEGTKAFFFFLRQAKAFLDSLK